MAAKRAPPDFNKVWSGEGIRGLRVGPARWTGIPLSMNGEAAEARPKPPRIPRHESSFLFFFRPIIAKLGDLYLSDLPHILWGEPTKNPDYRAMCELLAEDTSGDGWVPPRTFFPEFARYVGEGDWMDMSFVPEPPCPADQWYERRRTNQTFFRSAIHTWIVNVDGAYWQLVSKDQEMLDAVRQHMKGRDGFYCEPEMLG